MNQSGPPAGDSSAPPTQPPMPMAPLPPAYGPPPGYAPPPGQMLPYGGYAQPYGYPQRMDDPRARGLIVASNWLGWGGIILLFLGSPAIGFATRTAFAAGVVAAIGIVCAIVGAILGQIGRGMQGRVV